MKEAAHSFFLPLVCLESLVANSVMLGGSQLEDTLLIVHLVSHAFRVFSCKILRRLGELGCSVCLLLLADC